LPPSLPFAFTCILYYRRRLTSRDSRPDLTIFVFRSRGLDGFSSPSSNLGDDRTLLLTAVWFQWSFPSFCLALFFPTFEFLSFSSIHHYFSNTNIPKMKTMRTQAVFITILALLSLSSSALYFPADSHNNPHFPSTVAVVDSDIPPTRIVKRQVEASTTTTPIMSISTMNPAAWTSDTNTACLNAINASAIINPAGVVPCYNVLMYNPTNGEFLSEVRLFQVNNMVQASVVAGSTGSNVLFEFPHATINGSPGETDIQNLLTKRGVVLERASNIGDVTIVDAFYMNGTADITQR